MRRKRRYWYRIFLGECPVCGRGTEYRERVYSRRPKRPDKRYVRLSNAECYDQCLERDAIGMM